MVEEVKKKKKHKMTKEEKIRETIRRIIFSISLGVFVFAITGLLVIFMGYYISEREYKDVIEGNVDIGTRAETTTTKEVETKTDEAGEVIPIETQPENLYIPIKVEDDYYKAVNSDYRMFIYVPGTNVQYPVVMGKEGGYYLRYTFKGTENKAGAIFIDYRADENNLLGEFDTIICGHNRKDGTMFSDMTKYESEEYRDSNPYIYLVYNGREYVYEVFAYFPLDPVSKIYSPEISFESMMEIISENNTYKNTKVDIKKGDRVITLYTCNEDSSKRLITIAKLVREY